MRGFGPRIGYQIPREWLTLEQSNVHSWFKDELKKWRIGVFQGRGAPAGYTKRKPKMLDIAQSKIERKIHFFSGSDTCVNPVLFMLGAKSRAISLNYHYTTRRTFCQVFFVVQFAQKFPKFIVQNFFNLGVDFFASMPYNMYIR